MPAEVPLFKKLAKPIPVRVTTDMRTKLKILSRKNYVPMSQYIRAVLKQHLDKHQNEFI